MNKNKVSFFCEDCVHVRTVSMSDTDFTRQKQPVLGCTHLIDVHLMSLNVHTCFQSTARRIPNRKSSFGFNHGPTSPNVSSLLDLLVSGFHPVGRSYTLHNSSRQLALLWTWRPPRLTATLACLSLRWHPRSEGLRVCGTATNMQINHERKSCQQNKHPNTQRHRQRKRFRAKAFLLVCAAASTHRHATGHKSKETVTLSITLNLWGLEGSVMWSCHLWRLCSMNPRPPVVLFDLWGKWRHHNKHKCTFDPFSLILSVFLLSPCSCTRSVCHLYLFS